MNTTVRLPPLATIGELLKLYRLRALKKLSQNFLLDLRITDKIVKAAGRIEDGNVCEIGPGPGGITRSIMKKEPGKIIVIEKDVRFKPMLEGLAEASNCKFDIIFADILEFDLSKTFDSSLKQTWEDKPPNIHLIGNLPFSISTPLVIQWLKDISLKRNAWAHGRVKMTLTFQEEVAERMVAPILSKQRCRLSVMCQNWCKVFHKFTIPGSAFLPKPDVNVGVVHLEPLVEPIIPMDFHLVEKVVRTIFNSRQKYSINGAKNLFPEEMRKTLPEEMYKLADLKPEIRPFQIATEEWGRLCSAYKHICDHEPELYTYDYRGNRAIREHAWKEKIREDEDDNNWQKVESQ